MLIIILLFQYHHNLTMKVNKITKRFLGYYIVKLIILTVSNEQLPLYLAGKESKDKGKPNLSISMYQMLHSVLQLIRLCTHLKW